MVTPRAASYPIARDASLQPVTDWGHWAQGAAESGVYFLGEVGGDGLVGDVAAI